MTVEKKVEAARNDFELKSIDPTLLEKLYFQYNEIEDVKRFVKRAVDQFPKLSCGVASVYLKYLLNDGDIVHGKYFDNNHTFLFLKGSVIDITADQYGGPSVYVGPLKMPWSQK